MKSWLEHGITSDDNKIHRPATKNSTTVTRQLNTNISPSALKSSIKPLILRLRSSNTTANAKKKPKAVRTEVLSLLLISPQIPPLISPTITNSEKSYLHKISGDSYRLRSDLHQNPAGKPFRAKTKQQNEVPSNKRGKRRWLLSNPRSARNSFQF